MEAGEWAARHAVIAVQNEEARRLKQQRRAEAEAQRRVQVQTLNPSPQLLEVSVRQSSMNYLLGSEIIAQSARGNARAAVEPDALGDVGVVWQVDCIKCAHVSGVLHLGTDASKKQKAVQHSRDDPIRGTSRMTPQCRIGWTTTDGWSSIERTPRRRRRYEMQISNPRSPFRPLTIFIGFVRQQRDVLHACPVGCVLRDLLRQWACTFAAPMAMRLGPQPNHIPICEACMK